MGGGGGGRGGGIDFGSDPVGVLVASFSHVFSEQVGGF